MRLKTNNNEGWVIFIIFLAMVFSGLFGIMIYERFFVDVLYDRKYFPDFVTDNYVPIEVKGWKWRGKSREKALDLQKKCDGNFLLITDKMMGRLCL